MSAKTFLLPGAILVGLAAMALIAWTLLRGSEPPIPIPQADDSTFRAEETVLRDKLAIRPITRRAKNIILFIGDGMSIPTITAARIYGGQKRGEDGASNKLAMEQLPYSALSRTYSSDSLVTDSAPSATAMTAGIKGPNGTIGLDQRAAPLDCEKSRGTDVMTIFELAELAGLSTGIITTTRVTHATPAAAYAHTPGRDWEADSDMPPLARAQGCKDIAEQLVQWKYGNGFEVILGGGRQKFYPAGEVDPELPDFSGERADNRDLTAEWRKRYDNDATYVWNREQFLAVDPAGTKHLMGLFDPSYMKYEADRVRSSAPNDPSLAEMTLKSIDILKHNNNGYVLMVEGGRIDHAHHEGNAARALEDTLAFDAAIAAALKATDAEDTLIVITADHSHTLTISGYPPRDNPILGLVHAPDGTLSRDRNGLPYPILSYANGPGARRETTDLSDVDTTDIDFVQPSLVPLAAETHGGDDVAIFARGPYAHLFTGVVDENFIYHVMAYASQIPQRAKPH